MYRLSAGFANPMRQINGAEAPIRRRRIDPDALVPVSKVRNTSSALRYELRKQRGTSKYVILVPLIDLKFLKELAAGDAGTSNRRHWLVCELVAVGKPSTIAVAQLTLGYGC